MGSLEVDLSILVEVEFFEDLVDRLLSHVTTDDQLQVVCCATHEHKGKEEIESDRMLR